MGILASRFPDLIARGAEGGHGHFKTNVVVSHGGQEDRNQEWEDARGRWNVSKAIERTRQHALARSHFYKARGALHDFRFKDWHDFECARTGVDRGRLSEAAGGTLQVNKVYGTDEPDFEYVRPLYRLVAGTLLIWRNDALQTLGVNYTVNLDTGRVTPSVSWSGDTLEVACQFDVLCHYEADEFVAKLVHRRQDGDMLFLWDRIAIVETREVVA